MKNNIWFIFLLICLGLLFLNLKQCRRISSLKLDHKRDLSNLDALRDTIRIEINKNKEIQYSKQSLLVQKEELKQLNSKLYEELKKQRGNVIYISSNSGVIVPKDTVKSSVNRINDTSYNLISKIDKIIDSNNYRYLEISNVLSLDTQMNLRLVRSNILKDSLGFDLITGLNEENGKLRIFIRSSHSGMYFTKIDGALIDPRNSKIIKSYFPPKKFGLGLQAGAGVSSQLIPCFYVGVGVSYNIFTW